jgi:hypothetical protein
MTYRAAMLFTLVALIVLALACSLCARPTDHVTPRGGVTHDQPAPSDHFIY